MEQKNLEQPAEKTNQMILDENRDWYEKYMADFLEENKKAIKRDLKITAKLRRKREKQETRRKKQSKQTLPK